VECKSIEIHKTSLKIDHLDCAPATVAPYGSPREPLWIKNSQGNPGQKTDHTRVSFMNNPKKRVYHRNGKFVPINLLGAIAWQNNRMAEPVPLVQKPVQSLSPS
jgi:hypothetical protein